jgi:hypothetical protein
MCSFVTGGKGSAVKPTSGVVVDRVWPLPDACEVMAVFANTPQDLRGSDAEVLWKNMTPLLCESGTLLLGKFWWGKSSRIVRRLDRSPPKLRFCGGLSLSPVLCPNNPRNSPIGNMADNVGLTTPRGSGTSGYVQKNRSLLRPRDKIAPYPKDWEHAKHRPRQPDAEILEHEAKREVEVKVLELRDKLEDEGCVCDLRLPTPD